VSTRHVAAERPDLHDLTPQGSSGASSRRFRKKLAAEGFAVTEGFRVKPGFILVQTRAISARVNQNYDGWPSEELKKSYKTFLGKPCFVNHENHDPTKARGVVIAARYVENGADRYIETIMEVDAQRFPKLAKELKTGGLDSVSMGAEAGQTKCSYCGNIATDLHDMCEHVKHHKGKTLRRFDKKTGKHEDVLVYERCEKIAFFELSFVFEPADESAVASKVIVASRHTAEDDLAIPAPPGTPTIDQSVIDNTPVLTLPPATELTGQEAPGLKQSGKYTKDDFAAAGSRKPWETDTADSDATDSAAIEIEAMLLTAGQCPPGMDCNKAPMGEQITDANNMANQVSYDPAALGKPGGSAVSGGGGGKPDGSGILPNARPLYDQLMKDHPGADIGGYRVDNYHEHDSGALDFMTSDADQAATVRETACANGAPYVLWQQKQWNSDGSTSGMEDRGDPTQNHFDHVHIAPIPVPAAPEPVAAPAQPKSTAPTQRAAGKYTKDDFAIADGKKPWEREAPGPSEDADLKEIEAMVRTSMAYNPFSVHTQRGNTFNTNLDAEALMDQRNASVGKSRRRVRSAALRKVAHNRAMKLAYGEINAPMAVDTLREEGSAPEDDDDDFERYVEPPKDLQTPDLSQAAQIDRQQEQAGAPADQMGGVPGAAEAPFLQQGPQQQYMTLQIPMPSSVPQIPQQVAPPQMVSASVLDYFDNYYGRRVANWLDAVEAGRALTPEENADYRRQAAQLSTLENGRELSTTNRSPQKGTANMARTSLAHRTKVATAGRRQHFAEGPLVDGGDRSRNNQGEQEEAFLSQTPPAESGDYPTDDSPNIANTEQNLVAKVRQGRAQLLRDAQALDAVQRRRALNEAGGPTATVVDPKVQTGPEGEALTGDGFISADPNDGVSPTNPKDASLRAFQAFDGWLAQKTGKSSRHHSEATIKKAAAAFSREASISPQALFPALGIVLREARKTAKNRKATSKGASMRKRSNESLEVAAPDGRIDVETPVSNVTDADAQASQFDIRDFGNNAGDTIADPDLSTDQNWAPGEASKTGSRVKTAGGLLAMRCAEAMIDAGLEPNDRQRKYVLAAEFERMNRNLIADRVALLERFAAVRQADRRRAASGISRGAARSPIPAGLGGGVRTASPSQRLAAHDPSNDSSLFI